MLPVDMSWVRVSVKSYKPDIVILDMGDKFARTQGFARQMKHSRLMPYMHDR